jgi:uncharacterized protein YhhL (DUF1145 family)
MYFIVKLICICLYLATAGSLVLPFPHGLALTLQGLTVLFFCVHLLEIVFFMRYVRLYRGRVAVSIFLTLLFGVAHLKPLVDANKLNPIT